jgi:hypothetical protein
MKSESEKMGKLQTAIQYFTRLSNQGDDPATQAITDYYQHKIEHGEFMAAQFITQCQNIHMLLVDEFNEETYG